MVNKCPSKNFCWQVDGEINYTFSSFLFFLFSVVKITVAAAAVDAICVELNQVELSWKLLECIFIASETKWKPSRAQMDAKSTSFMFFSFSLL